MTSNAGRCSIEAKVLPAAKVIKNPVKSLTDSYQNSLTVFDQF